MGLSPLSSARGDTRLRRLLELASAMAGVGYWSYSFEDGDVSWSEQVYVIHGVARESFRPDLEQVLSFYHPDDQPILRRLIARAIEEGIGYDFRLRLIRSDGSQRHVSAKAECERDASGKVVGLFGGFQDITDEVVARERAEAAQRRASLAERIAGVGHWRVEYPSEALSWSDQMYEIYGLDPGSPVDVDKIMAMVHPDDRELTFDRLQGDLAGETVTERPVIRIVRPDGAIRWVVGDTYVERDPGGVATALFGTLRDVTEPTLTERRIEESEARYRRIADYSTDVIVLIGEGAVIEYVSPSCSAFGFEPQDVIGRKTIDLVHEDDRPFAIQVFNDLVSGKPIDRSLRREFRLRCKDGRFRWIEGKPNLVPATEGGPPKILTVYRDVTDRRALEDQLVAARAAAEKSAAVKSEFLANMSHELRTPLTSILGFSSLLAPHIDGDTQASHYAACIRNAAQSLQTIVNDVLDFSKLEAGLVEIEPRPVRLEQFLKDTVALVAPQASAKKLALSCETSGAPRAALMLDDARVRQVLLNLISNAVKFTGAGSVLVRAAATADNNRLRFEVQDTGSGIHPDRLDRLFKRFSQVDASISRTHGGTGLGLAICKGLVEAMGGAIGVSSVLGQGSVFHFELPLVLAEDAAFVTGDDVSCDLGLSGLRLLVVDDNSANRELVQAMAEAAGLEVMSADCGEAAVSLARDHPVDIILMDLRMPGMDGVTAARTIQTSNGPNCDTPILAFSADIPGGAWTGGEENPFVGAVQKPLVFQALMEELRGAL